MTEIQHRYAQIYDRLNNQPHLQELIATLLLEQLDREDEEEDWIQYHISAKVWQDLMLYEFQSVIDNIGWDIDAYEGSFSAYMLTLMRS